MAQILLQLSQFFSFGYFYTYTDSFFQNFVGLNVFFALVNSFLLSGDP